MPQKNLSNEIVEKIKQLSQQGLSHRRIASLVGVGKTTVSSHLKMMGTDAANDGGFIAPDFPCSDRPVEELLEHFDNQFKRVHAAKESRKFAEVKITSRGPIMLAAFGDLHADNANTNWPRLKQDLMTLKNTPNTYGIMVGDLRDNWVGRLCREFAKQTVTQSETLKIIEWILAQHNWLAIALGNHDHWNSDTGNVLDYIKRLSGCKAIMNDHDVRLQLTFPTGEPITLRVRHDFRGHSQYNPAHGLVKETLFGYRDNILLCGDRHHSGYMPVWHNQPEILCHAIRLGTYKWHDGYADEKGFKPENWMPSCAIVVNPEDPNPVTRVQVFFDMQAGAEYLKHLLKAVK